MRYSLLSRFSGGLLAGIIAENLTNLDIYVKPSQIMLEFGHNLQKSSGYLEDYQQYFSILSDSNEDTYSILGILPLILVDFDNFSDLEKKLVKFSDIMGLTLEKKNIVLIWSYLITLALREKLDCHNWLEQIQKQFSNLETIVLLELEKVNLALKQGASQATLSRNLDKNHILSYSIALSLYFFFRTPENLALCLLNAVKTPKQPLLTAIFTSVLAGVYNSSINIPLTWRYSVINDSLIQQCDQLALRLFALWCGILDYSTLSLNGDSAIAATGIMQQRASWRMISQ